MENNIPVIIIGCPNGFNISKDMIYKAQEMRKYTNQEIDNWIKSLLDINVQGLMKAIVYDYTNHPPRNLVNTLNTFHSFFVSGEYNDFLVGKRSS